MVMGFVRRLALTLLGLLFMFNVARGDPDTTKDLEICNVNIYGSNYPFANSVSYVLEDLMTVTPNHPGYDYYTRSPSSEARAFGHAVCNPVLSSTDCATCVSFAKSHILSECPQRIGAQLQLEDCRIRYENYQFSD